MPFDQAMLAESLLDRAIEGLQDPKLNPEKREELAAALRDALRNCVARARKESDSSFATVRLQYHQN